jgi:hypothetical protein
MINLRHNRKKENGFEIKGKIRKGKIREIY